MCIVFVRIIWKNESCFFTPLYIRVKKQLDKNPDVEMKDQQINDIHTDPLMRRHKAMARIAYLNEIMETKFVFIMDL